MCRTLDDFSNTEIEKEFTARHIGRCTLDDFSNTELEKELTARHFGRCTEVSAAQKALDHLAMMGCPSELVAPIEEWVRQPVADEARLVAWKAFCRAG